ncbi:MAG: peptidylprolyl isomerase [Lachnospiraceae bacterium]|nr:peptidylprolyl isomerase [Lachnospiraceae bacterium]
MASKKERERKAREKRQKTLISIALCAVVLVIIGAAVSGLMNSRSGKSGNQTESAASVSSAADASAKTVTTADDITITDYADITIKDHGTVTVALDGETAPETVKNFKALADSGFYNGLTFHRIIDGFMMQGGDPNGDGTGGSSETIRGEFSENGVDNPISHTRGAISMARSSNMNSASSQFFIVQSDSTFLDGQYAGFGYVTEGMDIVDEICKEAQPVDSNGLIASEAQPVIESIVVRAA